ncbi:hypothetical protein DL769_003334 [Monosporascus sp. CRB-8-3]|nr:hypothetical protein DL769_003334 [Monosporascus sp. CRB-8-3]
MNDDDLAVDNLSFSDCGTQLIVKWHGHAHPKVISIGGNSTYRDAAALQPHHMPCGLGTVRISEGHIGNMTSYNTGLHSGQVRLHRNSQGDQSFQRLEVSFAEPLHSGVSLTRVSNSAEQIQPILSLPNTDAARHLNVSAYMPRSRDEKIKIILNKASQPWGGFSSPVDTQFPAVAVKDRRAVRQSTERHLLEMGSDIKDEATSSLWTPERPKMG